MGLFWTVVAVASTVATLLGGIAALHYFWKNGEQFWEKIKSKMDKMTTESYLTWVRDRYSTIELRGVKRKGQQVEPLDLDSVYVPPQAQDVSTSSLIGLDQVLGTGQRLIITGGPGSGKTTALLHTASILATAFVTDNPTLAEAKLGLRGRLPLPIFIPLGAYAKHLRELSATTAPPRERTLVAFFSHYLREKKAQFALPPEFLQQLISAGHPVILLLDGLDEVPNDSERIQIREAIGELVTGRETMKAVVTCRTAAYKGATALGRNFREVRIKPPDLKHTEALIRRVYEHIYADDPAASTRKADELVAGIKKLEADRRYKFGEKVEPLISSPLLIRMSLIVHSDTESLPGQRAALYKEAIDHLLSSAQYAPDPEVGDWLGRLVGEDSETHRDLLKYLAFTMQKRGKTQGREIREEDLRQVLESKPFDGRLVSELIALTRLRGALLEERNGWYRFTHLTFQEYLAACYLAEDVRKESSLDEVASFLEEGPILESWWREPALLMVGHLSVTDPKSAQVFVRRLAGIDERVAQRNLELPADVQMATAEIATMAILEWPTAPKDLPRDLAERLVALYQDINLMSRARPSLRAAAGDALARLGDPHFRPYTWYLPNEPLLGFVEIPGGSFLMGSDKERDPLAHEDEFPQHEVELPTYYIARYPVTVAQLSVFIEESEQRAWTPDILGNHPATGLTWRQAIAYCKWLTMKLREWEHTPEPLATLLRTGWCVTLPSEAEWAKAARGTDGRIYPWGDEPCPNRANNAKTDLADTTPVHCFPNGASPYGVEDLSGNVWQMTRSLWAKPDFNYPYDPSDGRENLNAPLNTLRVIRGGAFDHGSGGIRCAVRNGVYADDRLRHNGFRVVITSGYPCIG